MGIKNHASARSLFVAGVRPPGKPSPYQYSVEVAHLPVQPLVLSTGQTKAHGEEHQGQSHHPGKHKADGPQVEPEE